MIADVDGVRWSAEDSAENRDRIMWADGRLEAWSRWQRSEGPHRVNYPRCSSFANAMSPQEEEPQAGARHVALDATDEEAMQVDGILAHWKFMHRGWWKVARKEYLTSGASEKKARELGMSRAEYRRQLDLLRMDLWKQVDTGAGNAIRVS